MNDRLQNLINEMMKIIKPEEIVDWKVTIDEYSEWSKTYGLEIRVILSPTDYNWVMSQGQFSLIRLKTDINYLVRRYISDYITGCEILSCEIYAEMASTNMFTESYFEGIEYV